MQGVLHIAAYLFYVSGFICDVEHSFVQNLVEKGLVAVCCACLMLCAAEGLQQSISAEDKRAQLRQETRARLLRAVQQTYEDIFERAHVAPTHLYKLKNSANRALDHTRDPLCDWNYLDDSFRTPTWLQLLQRSGMLHQQLHHMHNAAAGLRHFVSACCHAVHWTWKTH